MWFSPHDLCAGPRGSSFCSPWEGGDLCSALSARYHLALLPATSRSPVCGWERVQANSSRDMGGGLTQKAPHSSACPILGCLAWLRCKAAGLLMRHRRPRGVAPPPVSHGSLGVSLVSQKSHAGGVGGLHTCTRSTVEFSNELESARAACPVL